jgi:hypothetical protein
MLQSDFTLVLKALAAPFQRAGTFLRCAALPYLICMAFPSFMMLVDFA